MKISIHRTGCRGVGLNCIEITLWTNIELIKKNQLCHFFLIMRIMTDLTHVMMLYFTRTC